MEVCSTLHGAQLHDGPTPAVGTPGERSEVAQA